MASSLWSVVDNVARIINQSDNPPPWHPDHHKHHGCKGYDQAYLKDTAILSVFFGLLAVMCVLTLMIRTWAARHCKLPLNSSHVGFLMLMLLLSALRLAGFQVKPCSSVMSPGSEMAWSNLLGSVPMLLFLSVFGMLLYHVIIVLHSIRLAYQPLLHTQAYQRSNNSLPSQISSPAAVHARAVAQEASVDMQSQRKCCALRCSYWFTFNGRPHSTFKWIVISLNIVMWSLCAAAFILDRIGGDHRQSYSMFLYALEAPVVAMSLLMGVCFLVSAGALRRRLLELKNLPILERLETGDDLRLVTSNGSSLLSERFSMLPSSTEQLPECIPERRITGTVGTDGFESSESMDGGLRVQNGMSEAWSGAEGSDSPLSMCSAPPGATSPTCLARDVCAATAVPEDIAVTGVHHGARPHLSSRGSLARVAYSSRGSHDHLMGNARSPHRHIHSPTQQSMRASSATITIKSLSSLSVPDVCAQDEASLGVPSVSHVLSGVRRMLAVVSTCIVAFIWRAAVVSFVWVRYHNVWPPRLSVLYLFFAEVVPITMLLCLYLMPGLNAVCCSRTEALRPSVIESVMLSPPNSPAIGGSAGLPPTEGRPPRL